MGILGKFKAWWKVARPAWLPLLIGYGWMVVSWIIDFQVPSSGAILLSTCLIAEIRFNQQNWRKIAITHRVEGKRTRTEKLGERYEVGTYIITAANGQHPLDRLFAVAKPSDFFQDGETWNMSQVNDRVESVVFWVITISAIIGSVLWGYGHIYF